jgi:pSer/pThr/pTyr-binding forkhead associated (FHA) protein
LGAGAAADYGESGRRGGARWAAGCGPERPGVVKSRKSEYDPGMSGENKDTIIIQEKRKINAPGVLKNRAVLLILSSNYLGESFLLDKNDVIIGRSAACDIQVKDPGVSSEHCRIFIDQTGMFCIEDLGSTNATYLNRKMVKKPIQLFYGDRIVIGTTILRFFLEEKLDQ